MKKHWLIDAYNLLHARPSLSSNPNTAESINLLARQVQSLCKKEQRKAVLVFDGNRPGSIDAIDRISFHWTGRRSADEYIIRQIQKQNAHNQWIVVSDDREIRSVTGEHQVESIRATTFAGKLGVSKSPGRSSHPKPSSRNTPPEKRADYQVSDEEAERLMKLHKLREQYES